MAYFPESKSTQQSDWKLPKFENCESRLICITIGVALSAVAAVATYFCLVNGLRMLDYSYSSLSQFTAGFLIYSGVAFSVVAAGNLLYVGCKNLCHDEKEPFGYTPNAAKLQIGISLLAPVALVPCVIILALYGVLSNRS